MNITVTGQPVAKPRQKRGHYKITVQNKAWFKPTHGMKNTVEYQAWCSMWQRCTGTRVRSYKTHGGRGITVCERWRSFENFYCDVGPRPLSASLDRIDNDGNYDPGNCRWATREMQQNNKRTNHRITWNDKTMTLAQWSRAIGIRHDTLLMRIGKYQWTIDRAFTTPVRPYICA